MINLISLNYKIQFFKGLNNLLLSEQMTNLQFIRNLIKNL